MRILLATDGSPTAQAAIDLVAGRRWAPEAVVLLVAVDDAYGEERAELEAHVAAAAAPLRAADLEVGTAISGMDALACEAVTFDMDGVVIDTAVVHARAWKRLFDEYLAQRSGPYADGSSW